MKGDIYTCDRCNKWSSSPIKDRWVEIKATKGELEIKRAGIRTLTIDSSQSLHFCSPHCLLEYILDHINSNNVNNEALTKELIELFEDDVSINEVDKIATYKIELNGKIPSNIWKNEVLQLGLDPNDYVISNEDGNSIINIYKSYYTKNE